MIDECSRGTRVETPDGLGTIAYVRMAPPEYTTVQAVSVVLDHRRLQPNYAGTVYHVSKVRELCDHRGCILHAGHVTGHVRGES